MRGCLQCGNDVNWCDRKSSRMHNSRHCLLLIATLCKFSSIKIGLAGLRLNWQLRFFALANSSTSDANYTCSLARRDEGVHTNKKGSLGNKETRLARSCTRVHDNEQRVLVIVPRKLFKRNSVLFRTNSEVWFCNGCEKMKPPACSSSEYGNSRCEF